MARPLRSGEPSNLRLRVRITASERRALTEVARENRANVSRVVRDAVNEYVADYRDRQVFRGPKT